MKLYLAKIIWTTIGLAVDYKLVNATSIEDAKCKVNSIYKQNEKPDFIMIDEPVE